MDTEAIKAYCLQKPGAVEAYPFGEFPVCYKVGGKIFAQIYPDKITVKCTAFSGQAFRQAYPDAVVRGYHCPPVQQPYWNTIWLDRFPGEELPMMIDHAYETVVSGLSRRVRQSLFPEATLSCAIGGGSNPPLMLLSSQHDRKGDSHGI